MTDKINAPADDKIGTDEPAVDGVQPGESEDTVDSLKAKLAEANAEAAKYRKTAKDAIAKRDAVKKGGSDDGQDYKKLYADADAKATKIVERVKRADILSAATAQLTKVGATADGLAIAQKLLDINSVEWDEESGVDVVSIRGAVATLKNEYPSLFERVVAPNKVKPAKDGNSGGNDNEMSRADFNKLSPGERMKKMISGNVKIV